ncbi:3-deoxy-D-arabino-heptulosonate 7-phosphate synthase [Cupriavidus sp. WGlv3]|uniref:3-deoxy-D-arabino-heptulosonate 7-phosphate synthase n=1 Tax=Cupriavidus sp. WGlv3 TaxID=2919924 RepID=UPI00209056C4|nr:3-deoxy-D-arabino-heptulosonate 7-phosphate synthase [Cupriavidus sp. WGlv3]MCO4865730.1 3-deoxy-D-arabino-heptulosonate 7-phosphate synthase [Cupriavidus sp. WGlv3]
MDKPQLPPHPLLDVTLRAVPRRYRLPELDNVFSPDLDASPGTTLALVIEQARTTLARGETPDAALKDRFTGALARMVREAMRTDGGDPVFQAMVLRHRAAPVREYASLSACADQDRRAIHAAVNAVAHPGKQQRLGPGPQREALARLHACAGAAAWNKLHDAVQQLLEMPQMPQMPASAGEPQPARALAQLLEHPALARLRRLDALASDALVVEYLKLWERYGPRSGSASAVAQGLSSRQRGDAAEAQAALALEALAQRLNAAPDASAPYRVVTSLRVPAAIPAAHKHAKTEWDVVLLRQSAAASDTAGGTPAWDVCLLVEVKASVDAAATDFPRLLRGLRLLAHADKDVVYPFATRQGTVPLRGAALCALPSASAALSRTVLYCCDAPAEPAPRLLSAASRMQLLSATPTLDFAVALTEAPSADARELEPVWQALLEAPGWRAVLDQYATLRQVRELMVHTDDLLAAV